MVGFGDQENESRRTARNTGSLSLLRTVQTGKAPAERIQVAREVIAERTKAPDDREPFASQALTPDQEKSAWKLLKGIWGE